MVAQSVMALMIMNGPNIPQSSLPIGQKIIERATQQNKLFFAVYMLVTLLAAILTYLLWNSSNKVQDAIVADANARIGEANQKAAEANERAQELEQSNLTLQGHVATLQMTASTAQENVAELQKLAADAMSTQQRVELDLEKQKEKTADAEKRLFDLAERQSPRFIEGHSVSDSLKGKPSGTAIIWYQPGDPEHTGSHSKSWQNYPRLDGRSICPYQFLKMCPLFRSLVRNFKPLESKFLTEIYLLLCGWQALQSWG
jgi:hypothetical protein